MNVFLAIALTSFSFFARATTKAPVVRCNGDGYIFELMDANYAYYADGELTTPVGALVPMDCSIYTGQKNSSWYCSSKSEDGQAYHLIMFGAEFSSTISAKLSRGKAQLAALECNTVH